MDVPEWIQLKTSKPEVITGKMLSMEAVWAIRGGLL